MYQIRHLYYPVPLLGKEIILKIWTTHIIDTKFRERIAFEPYLMINESTKTLQHLCDAELVLCWQKGDKLAFSEIYRRHVLLLLKIAISKTNNKHIAEELVQNAFLKLFEHKKEINSGTSIKAYLYVSIRNQIFNFYRHEVVEDRYQEYCLQHLSEGDNSMSEIIETRELEKTLEVQIAALPKKCKAVFLLRRQENLSNRQIGFVLGISENTVEQHMRKALNRLKSSLSNLMSLF
jgi:RNA polymerase sigma-70 factor (family 1)